VQPSEALSASAQIAVTLAGFAGVVVAFRSRAVHEWTRLDKFRLQILLTNSATPFGLSILAMVLSSAIGEAATTWRLCSLVAFVIQILVGASYRLAFRGFTTNEFKAAGGRSSIMYSGSLIAVVVTVLQLYNVIRLQTFWPFFASIATLLIFAMLQFILLVIAGHEPKS
jgi:hypothetical protein